MAPLSGLGLVTAACTRSFVAGAFARSQPARRAFLP